MAEKTKQELMDELAQKEAQIEAMQAALENAAADAAAAPKPQAGEADPTRRVTVKLFKDNDRYKEPLFVSVNDYRAAIPRGVTVEIPYYVAKHIEETTLQDESAAMLISEMTNEYDEKAKVIG